MQPSVCFFREHIHVLAGAHEHHHTKSPSPWKDLSAKEQKHMACKIIKEAKGTTSNEINKDNGRTPTGVVNKKRVKQRL